LTLVIFFPFLPFRRNTVNDMAKDQKEEKKG
jgi:hypothetical protein